MTFKITNNLTSDAKKAPVIPVKEGMRYVQCKDFTDEASSITGIISKFLFCSRINQLTGQDEWPTLTVICGEGCKEKCLNFKS